MLCQQLPGLMENPAPNPWTKKNISVSYNSNFFLKPRDQTKSGFRNNFLEEDVYYVFLLGMKMVQNVPNGPKWSKMVQLFEEKIPKLT